MIASPPENETERLKALYECRILDTPPEDAYDDITRLAAQVCGTEIATVTLIDRHRQWFKSAVGLDKREDRREVAFCAHAILQPDLMVVPDATADPRFADNPLVTGDLNVRFYAGAPVVTEDGFALGTLCVIDRAPRTLTGQQASVLAMLARQVADRLELQRRVQIQESLLDELRASHARVARKAALIDISRDAILVQEPATGRIVFWSRGAETTYGWTRREALGRVAFELLRTEFPLPREDIMAHVGRLGGWEGDLTQARKDGTRLVVASRWALHAGETAFEVLEVNRDVTEQRRLEAAREAYNAQQGRIAETLQRSLLMHPPPDIFPGLTVKAYYCGAEEDVLVGGDFFDLFAVAENKVALVVGDATGKGLEAAAYTAEVKFALRVLLGEDPTPAVALTRLNKFIAAKERLDPRLMGRSYVALSVAVVDTATGEVEAALAGMERLLLLRTSESRAVTFGAGGPLMGMIEEAEYECRRDRLGENDLLVMTTDGLLEARSPERRLDFFGTEGLSAAILDAQARTTSLADTAQAVVGRARAFAGGAIRDDVCLLLACRRDRAAPAR